MKRTKKLLSLLLAAIMILPVFAVSASAGDISQFKAGDTITFGSYPQSKVTDEKLITNLNGCRGEWVNPPSLTGGATQYKDVVYQGNTYRAIKFSTYNRNGYVCNEVYWFMYEPIKWIVLDAEKNLIISSIILDSQQYNYSVKEIAGEYYNDDGFRANDWEHSSFRKWLNTYFFNIAFSDKCKTNIDRKKQINVSYPVADTYADNNTSDNIFILSSYEIDSYSHDYRRIATDYAYSQDCNSHQHYHDYWVRNANSNSSVGVAIMGFNNSVWASNFQANGFAFASGSEGVVPAIYLKDLTDSKKIDAPTITASNVASSGKIKLTWKAVDGATSYKVYRATSKNGTYKLMKTTSSTSYVNTSAVAGQTYYYKVKAVAADGTASKYSSVKTRTCDLAKPVVTTSNVSSSGKIKLTWDKVDGATSYKVYRATSKDGTYKLMKTTTSTSHINTSAVGGKTYYYKVKAVCSNSAADSAYSSIKTRTCDLAKPTNVQLYFNSSNNPVVKWSKVDGATSYKVYRATSQNGTYKLLKTTTSTSFTNTSITHGTTYYYKIKAVCSNSAADSAYSAVVNGYIK